MKMNLAAIEQAGQGRVDSENIEQRNNEIAKDGEDELLTEQEALIYQEYATKKEGVEFSKKAKDESYKEAEKLLHELQQKNIKIDDLDLSKIDLTEATSQHELCERLEMAIRQIAKDKTDGGILKKLGKAIDLIGGKRIVALLSLFATLSVAEIAEGRQVSLMDTPFGKNVTNVMEMNFAKSRVIFGYDQMGNPVDIRFHAFDLSRPNMVDLENILKDEYKELLHQSPRFNKERMRGNNNDKQIVITAKSLLERVKVYRELVKKNKNQEAQFLRKNMAESIGMLEHDTKAVGKIFDVDTLRSMLDAS